MSLTRTPLPFGLRDVKLKAYTDAAATTLGSTPVDLPNSRTLSFSETEDFEELRGDDALQASHGSGPNVEWELEGGGVSLEAVALMYGGTVTTSGVAPNQVKTLTKRSGDVRPYFQIEGQSISDSGGDLHIVIPRCKATGDLSGELGEGKFFLTGASGTGFPSKIAADIDVNGSAIVWKIVDNETATAIT